MFDECGERVREAEVDDRFGMSFDDWRCGQSCQLGFGVGIARAQAANVLVSSLTCGLRVP